MTGSSFPVVDNSVVLCLVLGGTVLMADWRDRKRLRKPSFVRARGGGSVLPKVTAQGGRLSRQPGLHYDLWIRRGDQ